MWLTPETPPSKANASPRSGGGATFAVLQLVGVLRNASGNASKKSVSCYISQRNGVAVTLVTALIAAGTAAAKKLAHARILLKADQADSGPAWADEEIADAVEVSTDTVARVRQRFVEQGLEAALVRKTQDQPSRPRVLDGTAEAKLLAVACSEPPDGRRAWTLRMLADKLVELEVVGAVSTETVRRAMKKTPSSRT